jgi:rhamnulose-1-phosphate aldolase
MKSMKKFKDIKTASFIKEMCDTTANMYRLGWDERNGGNISYLVKEEELKDYLDLSNVIREIPFEFDATELAGKYFLVTGTGKYFKNVINDPETNLGIIRIAKEGNKAELLWGWSDGGKFTSELPAHLMGHMTRLKINPNNRIILHTHPTNTLAMGFVVPLEDKAFTKEIWQMCTECIVVFPDGIGVLPWMLCGNNEIGVATAKKFEEYRIVIWGLHGIYGCGESFDEAFGLVETVEKAAELYLKVVSTGKERLATITDKDLVEVAKHYNLDYRKDFIND